MSPSASKLKKKPKARLSRGGPGPDRSEAGAHSQRVEPANLPARLEDRGKADPPTGEYQDDPTNPDPPRVLEDGSEKNTAGEHRSDRKSTVSAAAKFLLCTVRDSADAFPPLKSVAGGICSLLENYERAKGNKQTIESLAPRIKSLGELLRSPVSEGDAREELRRKELERKLSGVHQGLALLAGQGKVDGFLKSAGNAGKLGGLLEDVRDAMMEYQASLQQDIYDKSCRLIVSLPPVCPSLVLSKLLVGIGGSRPTQGNAPRRWCWIPLWKQARVPERNEEGVLWQIESWLADDRDQRVFWLNGLAGTGKSTIAQTFAETSFSDGKLGASFFCSRDFEDRSNIQNIFPTLAFQLAYRYPQFRKELLLVLRGNPDIERDSLCSQLETLIINPFKTTQIPTLIIIDALDECKDEEPASAILSVLSRYADRIPRVKFFITGRPEPRIRTGFRLELLRPITEVLRLHDVERSSVDGDIKLFFETRLGDIAKTRSDCDLTESWPSSYDIDVLCKKAAGLFIYASTVVKFVASPHHSPTERLTLVVSLRHSTAHEGKSGIDLLYTQVLEQAFHDADSDEQELYSGFKQVVGAVLLVFYPLSRKTLSELLKNCTPSHVSSTLRSLHSLLLVPTSEVDPIRSFHKSFPDFLTDRGRCKDERFFVSPSIHHIDILSSCLDLMEERLRRNICNLDGCPILSEVKDLPVRKETYIGSALEYACRFWTKHLVEIGRNGSHLERVRKLVDRFFTKHLLFWIEVLSLTGNLNSGVYALHDVDLWYLSTGVSCKWTSESQRLILSNFDEIHDSPTKLYRYVLPFCPSSSWLHERYTAESLQEVKVVAGRPDKWETSYRVTSFNSHLEALAYQKDVIAAGLGSGNIVVLDPVTGFHKSVLSEHTSSVISLTFSMDGTLLVSGGGDRTIKLWDIQTGGVVKTFHTSPHQVCSVSISPDAITVASGSHDNTICLWDVRTGKGPRIITISPQPRVVTWIGFLPDLSGHLVSVSAGGSVQRWNVNGNKVGPRTSGRHIAFSLDSRRFVLCGEGAPIVRDSTSGAVITTLHSPGQGFSRCCFSPNGEFIAGAAGETIYVWNVAGAHPTPRLIKTIFHDSKASSLLFSPSYLVSAHGDRKIRFWQIDDNPLDSTTTNAESTALVPPAYITLQGREGFAITLDSTKTALLWDLSTGLPKILLKWVDGCSPRLINGILIAVSRSYRSPRDESSVWKISSWDVKTGKKDRTAFSSTPIDRHGSQPVISEDGSTLLSAGPKWVQTWSALTGESRRLVEHGFSHTPDLIPDGSTVLILFKRSIKRLDLGNLELRPFDSCDTTGRLWGKSFQLVDNEVRHVTSGSVLFRLPPRLGQGIHGHWDSRYLVALIQTGVLILDFVHMLPQ